MEARGLGAVERWGWGGGGSIPAPRGLPQMCETTHMPISSVLHC